MKNIEEKDSPLISMISFSREIPYKAIKDLKSAKDVENAYVVMEGDWGGQIYLTCPTKYVKCSEEKLKELLKYLDNICWSCNEGDGANIYYEVIEDKLGVSGGMGGGATIDGLWIHKELIGRFKDKKKSKNSLIELIYAEYFEEGQESTEDECYINKK